MTGYTEVIRAEPESQLLSKCLVFLVFPSGQWPARRPFLDCAVQLRTPKLGETGDRQRLPIAGAWRKSQANQRSPVANCDDRLLRATRSRVVPLLATGVLLRWSRGSPCSNVHF